MRVRLERTKHNEDKKKCKLDYATHLLPAEFRISLFLILIFKKIKTKNDKKNSFQNQYLFLNFKIKKIMTIVSFVRAVSFFCLLSSLTR